MDGVEKMADSEPRETADPEGLDVDVTGMLLRWQDGDEASGSAVLEFLYPLLHGMARLRLAGSDVSLRVTELVHELYLKLSAAEPVKWRSRAQFFAFAGRVMRHLVVDHVRRGKRSKRGGGAHHLQLDETLGEEPKGLSPVDLLALDEALEELESHYPGVARLVELKFFVGLEVPEMAHLLEMSPRSVKRRWRFARAWLHRSLESRALGS